MYKFYTTFKNSWIALFLLLSSISYAQTPCSGGAVYNGTGNICLNSSTGDMTLGGNVVGTVKRWEKKLSSASTWTSIANTTTTYSENPSLAGTWQYRAVVGAGTCEAFSIPFDVIVNPALTIALTNPNLITCYSASNSSVTLNYAASTGNINTVKITFTNNPTGVGNSGATEFTPSADGAGGSLEIPLYGAAQGTYNGQVTLIKNYPACTNTITYPITLTIGSTAVGGTVSAAQTICAGSTPAALTLTGNTGSVVKWQKSNVQNFATGVTDIASTSTILSGSAMGPISANTYFRAVVQSGSCAVAYATPVLITVGATSTYNGANWSNGIPDNTNSLSAVIASNYTTAGNFTACNCTVNSGATLTVAPATSATIKNNLINDGTIIIKTGGNLLQTNPASSAYSGAGTFTVEKSVTDMNNLTTTAKRDFVYWSSPVAAQTLQNFSPGTPNNQRLQYTEATDYFVITPDTSFLPAKGYTLGAETTLADGYNKTYQFTGIPNNGNYSINLTKTGDGYNLVGNPYPSNIDFDILYANNSTIIDNSLWRWTNTTYTPGQQGSAYNQSNYVVYNGTGGQTPSTGRQIAVGQGFFVKKSAAGNANLNFTNNLLRVSTAGQFYQKNANTADRFWLTLTSGNGIANTQLIGYVGGATDGYDDNYDAEALGLSSDLFYSPLQGKKLVVQGKNSAFQITDKVKLGANFFASGNYTISIEQPEGIFAASQMVYLKDNQLNTYTDLKAGPYTFFANEGLNENRFEIVYEHSVLATADAVKTELAVYKKGDNFFVHSTQAIDRVEVLDAAGRMIKIIPASSSSVEISTSTFAKGVYVLTIKLKDGSVQTKKIIK